MSAKRHSLTLKEKVEIGNAYNNEKRITCENYGNIYYK
jgi:hypothetical protein